MEACIYIYFKVHVDAAYMLIILDESKFCEPLLKLLICYAACLMPYDLCGECAGFYGRNDDVRHKLKIILASRK